jgi:hypothetical protein
MFPARHSDVAAELEEHSLTFSFYNVDESSCVKEYDSNIKGFFSCYNPKCSSDGWYSKLISITIRMYRGQRYNARVYHQRCRVCNWLGKPHIDESYAERVAYRLKKWSGVKVKKPKFNKGHRKAHETHLCEGCNAGHCPWLKSGGWNSAEELDAY